MKIQQTIEALGAYWNTLGYKKVEQEDKSQSHGSTKTAVQRQYDEHRKKIKETIENLTDFLNLLPIDQGYPSRIILYVLYQFSKENVHWHDNFTPHQQRHIVDFLSAHINFFTLTDIFSTLYILQALGFDWQNPSRENFCTRLIAKITEFSPQYTVDDSIDLLFLLTKSGLDPIKYKLADLNFTQLNATTKTQEFDPASLIKLFFSNEILAMATFPWHFNNRFKTLTPLERLLSPAEEKIAHQITHHFKEELKITFKPGPASVAMCYVKFHFSHAGKQRAILLEAPGSYMHDPATGRFDKPNPVLQWRNEKLKEAKLDYICIFASDFADKWDESLAMLTKWVTTPSSTMALRPQELLYQRPGPRYWDVVVNPLPGRRVRDARSLSVGAERRPQAPPPSRHNINPKDFPGPESSRQPLSRQERRGRDMKDAQSQTSQSSRRARSLSTGVAPHTGTWAELFPKSQGSKSQGSAPHNSGQKPSAPS